MRFGGCEGIRTCGEIFADTRRGHKKSAQPSWNPIGMKVLIQSPFFGVTTPEY